MITQSEIIDNGIQIAVTPDGCTASRNGWTIERDTLPELMTAIHKLLPWIMALEPWMVAQNGRGAVLVSGRGSALVNDL